MNLAILSCGPSLQAFLDNPVQHDAYMGVNRAVSAWPCQWWVSGDPCAFTYITPIGTPKIFTGDYMDAKFPMPAQYTVMRNTQIYRCLSEKKRAEFRILQESVTPTWKSWSAINALIMSYLVLEAKRLTLYGYDMRGHAYWNNEPIYLRKAYPPPQSMMDEVRWDRERYYFGSVVEWLIRRGVEVEVVHRP